jgi:hypothetical protein
MEFSDLALAKLLQTSPELGSLILTFQDLSEEAPPESGMKVGTFVLRSGAELFFVPVIAKGDTLYPLDSLFLESTGKFMPLSKKVIEGIVNNGQIEPGKPVKIPKTVDTNPSLQSFINPPRTGKFVYASSSRMLDFMAAMPERVRGWVFEKIASEKTVYDNLDKMFGLKTLFDVLKPGPVGSASRAAQSPISVVTEANPRLTDDEIKAVINEGYAVIGEQPTFRTAVSVQPFARDGIARQVTSSDGEADYDISFSNGTAREAFLPRMHRLNASPNHLAVFSNSDYATSREGFVAVGDPLDRKKVLDRTFQYNPPVLLKDTMNGDKIAIMTGDGSFLGPFTVDRVVQSGLGVDISITGSYGKLDKVCGYRNFRGDAESMDGTLYVPFNSIVLRLNKDLSLDLERSVLSASRRRDLESLRLLGDEINLRFDGVEFFANGAAIGGVPQTMSMLVVKEGVDPALAKTFVKQAQETKSVKIYLTKQAFSSDANPAEIPQYGTTQPDPAEQVGPQGSFIPAVQKATEVGDSQTVEASILSQLLQVPDLHEQIEEYLPDIEEAVDRLGRILFLSRLNITTLAESLGPDAVFALLAQMKSVYRMLGENVTKLKQTIQTSRVATADQEG